MLKYVQNKDVFMRYHKAHLARRLILDASADNEKEEIMVNKLRVKYSRDLISSKNCSTLLYYSIRFRKLECQLIISISYIEC